MKICLTGPFFSGKTSVAEYIRDNYNGYVIDYTGLLKSMAVQAINQVNLTGDLTLKKLIKEKKKYRSFLQELGVVLGFDEGFGVDGLVKRWQWEGSVEPVVFDNARFQPQWDILKGYGFKLVSLSCDIDEIVERAFKMGVKNEDLNKWIQHPAEAGINLDDASAIIQTGNKSVKEVVDQIMEVIK